MTERKINLEEILINVFEPSSQYCSTPLQDLQLAITLNPDVGMIKDAMIEFGKRLLELAAENATVILEDKDGNGTHGKLVEQQGFEARTNKQSILNTINQIE